jgi:hypothetical protein
MLDFKPLYSARNLYKQSQGNFGGGVEVWQKHVTRNDRPAVQNLDFLQKKKSSGAIGAAEELLTRYGAKGSGWTGQVRYQVVISKYPAFMNKQFKSKLSPDV